MKKIDNKVVVVALFLVIIVAAYLLLTRNAIAPTPEQMTDTSKQAAAMQETYTGSIPCADCEEIQVKLDLNTDNTYTMTSIYVGREVAPLEETGTYTEKKGDATNSDAKVVLLTASTGTVTNFLQVNDNELQQLDDNLQPQTGNPYSMTLKKSTR